MVPTKQTEKGRSGAEDAPSPEIWHIKRGYYGGSLTLGRQQYATAKTAIVHQATRHGVLADTNLWRKDDIVATFPSREKAEAAMERSARAFQSGDAAVKGAERQLADAKRRRDEKWLNALSGRPQAEDPAPDDTTGAVGDRRDGQ